jgi:chorismate mutase
MKLEDLRKMIDETNDQIIALFSKRLEIAKEIAKIKKENKLPVYDPEREEKQRALLRILAQKHGLSAAVVEEIFQLFVEYSKLMMKMEMGPCK